MTGYKSRPPVHGNSYFSKFNLPIHPEEPVLRGLQQLDRHLGEAYRPLTDFEVSLVTMVSPASRRSCVALYLSEHSLFAGAEV